MKSQYLLYGAYLSTCLEDRAWSFCVSLCMQLLGGMQLVSIEQLAESLVQIVLSGPLGRFLDHISRKSGIMLIMPINNLTIVAASAFAIGCISVDPGNAAYTVLLIFAMLSCAVNRLCLNAEKFMLGRDWVVVISSSQSLSGLNSILTTIDQFANVISPLVTGVLVSLCGLRTTCAIFGAGSILSFVSKCLLLRTLYQREPALQKPREKPAPSKEPTSSTVGFFNRFGRSFVIYFSQREVAAAFGMALLFMTVLGFDGLAVGYGESIGLPEMIIGLFRSYGSFMGIAGALSYSFFERRLGIRSTGLLGVICQHTFLLLAVISIWLPGSPWDPSGYFSGLTFNTWWSELKASFNGQHESLNATSDIDWGHFTVNGTSMVSIFVFLFAIATARYGLWTADLSITQIMQMGAAESHRNTVFGVHNAICQAFSTLKDILVIVLPDPSTFGICILISYGFVLTGHLFYIYYIVKHRGEPIGEEALLDDNVDGEQHGKSRTFTHYSLEDDLSLSHIIRM